MGWQVPIQPVAYTPEVATDTTARTANSTSFQQITAQYDVPANDAEAGSVYKMTLWGPIAFQAPADVPSVEVELFGVTLGSTNINTSSSGNLTGNVYLDVWVIVNAAGASGNVSGVIQVTGATSTTPLTGTGFFTAVSVNTTADSQFFLNGKFSAVTASPTLTINASVYERDGPGAAPLL